jgi:RNA polymerase sigma-70 factor (ECF subfamily)
MHEFADRLAGTALSGPLAELRSGKALAGDSADDLAREFEARLADCGRLAVRVAYSVVRHHQDAEDVAQEAFVRAHKCFHQLRDRDSFRSWLVRTTWRLAIDHRRSAKRRVVREQVPIESPAAPNSEEMVIAKERSARLWDAIDALPEKLRMAIVLASIEGHGIAEVAVLTGAPEGTVKSRLFDARKLLHERLR